MTGSGAPVEKICVVCGSSCADRPRVKNAQGQYACRTCAESREPMRANSSAAKPSAAASPRREQRSGAYGVELEGAPPALARPCPACGRKMSTDASVCAHCGYDRTRGIESAAGLDGVVRGMDGPRCASCGYSLRGLRAARCPECGTPFRPRSRRGGADDSRSIVRMAYLTPLLMLLIGAGGVSLFLLLTDTPASAGVYLLRYGALVPIGVGVYFVCCLLWIGFDAPLHLTALRLAGIYAVVDLCTVLLDLTDLPYLIIWLFGVCLYVAMLAQLLEIEVNDAIMVAILTGILKFIIGIFIVVWLLNGAGA